MGLLSYKLPTFFSNRKLFSTKQALTFKKKKKELKGARINYQCILGKLFAFRGLFHPFQKVNLFPV